ncbi:MAG: hypothetical protein NTW97_01975 [Candidatus Krumholzibacteria bacterium]|nr:hypothetical protein [Candidatus Krumholzibacteria bacterium]
MTNAEYVSITASDWRAARYLLNHCRTVDASRNRMQADEIPYPIKKETPRRRANRRNSPPPFAGRWLGKVKISAREWLRIVELYAGDKPAAFIAAEAGVSYPTVRRALDTIQSAIASSPEDQAVPGMDSNEDSAVYGICPSEGGGHRSRRSRRIGFSSSSTSIEPS